MNIPSGLYYMDGVDLGTNFSMIIEDGSADFLRFAPKKESITHDWGDANGIDVDLSRVFFKERSGTLNCAIITTSEVDFWPKYRAFISLLTQPGLRRLQLTAHGQQSYYIYYQECTSYKQVKSLKGDSANPLIAHKFSILVVEPNPKIDASNKFIVTANGKFLIA
jgi:hypothetical protein